MPIHSGKDNQGTFYQWGKTGKKYYYESSNEESRKRAYKKAEQQQTAIYSSGYKGDSEMKKPTMKLVNVIVKRKDSKPVKKVIKKSDTPDIASLFKQLGSANSKLNNAAADIWKNYFKDNSLKLDGSQQHELLDYLSDYISEMNMAYKNAKSMLEDVRKKWKAG